MFAFLSTGTELRRFGKGTLPKIALVVLMFIPLIYGALYLWAFWAPDKELSHLPVALVNSDTGAMRDGKAVTAAMTWSTSSSTATIWVGSKPVRPTPQPGSTTETITSPSPSPPISPRMLSLRHRHPQPG
ncbi:hypothetical protein ACOM2C_14455 [Pseudarthrobacter sp. So.54]